MRFDRAYQVLQRILDILKIEPTEPQRRELQDALSDLEHDSHQHGFSDGQFYRDANDAED